MGITKAELANTGTSPLTGQTLTREEHRTLHGVTQTGPPISFEMHVPAVLDTLWKQLHISE